MRLKQNFQQVGRKFQQADGTPDLQSRKSLAVHRKFIVQKHWNGTVGPRAIFWFLFR
jgi:hypothetical protein